MPSRKPNFATWFGLKTTARTGGAIVLFVSRLAMTCRVRAGWSPGGWAPFALLGPPASEEPPRSAVSAGKSWRCRCGKIVLGSTIYGRHAARLPVQTNQKQFPAPPGFEEASLLYRRCELKIILTPFQVKRREDAVRHVVVLVA